MTSEERTAQIDRELDHSLGVFDAEMRREQGVIAQSRGARDGSGTGGGSDSAGAAATPTGSSAGSNGAGKDTNGAGVGGSGNGGKGGSGGRQGAGTGEGGAGGQGQTGGAAGGRSGGGGGYGGGAMGGNGPTTAPADIPDGSDDDIVARQLREAAMKETDPELREKLWQEYRNYKKGAK